MIRYIYASLVLLMTLALPAQVLAGVTTIQELDFGEWIVKNNDAVHNLTVNISGPAYTYDSAGYIPINVAPLQVGIYDLDGMTPLAAIASVVITQINPMSGASGPNFQMTAFQESHPATVDGGGVVRVRVGATLQTSGSGTSYADQAYSGTMQIQINF